MATPKPTGFSGTPLAKKLGYRDGTHANLVDAPTELSTWLAPLPADVCFENKLSPATDLVHLFTTDITEDVIRSVALPMGYGDIKVCAVSEVWSGLKLVIRKELR